MRFKLISAMQTFLNKIFCALEHVFQVFGLLKAVEVGRRRTVNVALASDTVYH